MNIGINIRTYLREFSKRAIACCIALLMLLSHSTSVIAQSIPDIEAPLVELEFVGTAPADINQVFTVQAFDDIGLGDVSLHHRRAGESSFIKSLMEPVGDTGFFSIAIDTDPNDLRSFEYYAQALDLNGNRTVTGFAFDPFVREITAAAAPTFSANTPTEPANETVPTETESEAAVIAQNSPPIDQPSSSTNSNRRWLYIALGVLAAGAVASQLGGGGGSSDGSIGGDDSLVPLTVTIGDPIP